MGIELNKALGVWDIQELSNQISGMKIFSLLYVILNRLTEMVKVVAFLHLMNVFNCLNLVCLLGRPPKHMRNYSRKGV